MTLELPLELESQIERAARARGTDPAAWLIDAAKRALDASARDAQGNSQSRASAPRDRAPQAAVPPSPMEAALEQIKANPLRTVGPIDAAADLEELRAGRMEELGA